MRRIPDSCEDSAGKAGECSGETEAYGEDGEFTFSMVCNVDYLHCSASSIEIIRRKKCSVVVYTLVIPVLGRLRQSV